MISLILTGLFVFVSLATSAWPARAQSTAIAISDYALTHAPVVQRSPTANLANVTFDGTYTGTAPTAIYIQIVNYDNHSAVVQPWSECLAPTIADGTWSGCTISVPTAAKWVAAIAGTNGSPPAATSGYTTTAWGVGSVFVMAGDSLAGYYSNKFVGRGDPPLNAVARQWCGTYSRLNGGVAACNKNGVLTFGWSNTTAVNTSSGYRALLATIQPAFNWPIAIFNSAVFSSALNSGAAAPNMTWTNFCSTAGCSPWGKLVADLALAGITDFEAFIWYQGGQDSRRLSPPSKASATTSLRLLYSHILQLTSRSATQLPMFVEELGPETTTVSPPGAYDAGFNNMRQAYQLCPLDLALPAYNCQFSSTSIDLPPDTDRIHPTAADYRRIGFRDGQTIVSYYQLKNGTYSGAGPSIANATFFGSTVTVTINLNGSTGLVNAKGSNIAGALSGWTVTDAGGASISAYSFTEPDQLVITLNQPLTAPVSLSYMQGISPSIANAVYGNALPGADSMGLALLPSIGTIAVAGSQ